MPHGDLIPENKTLCGAYPFACRGYCGLLNKLPCTSIYTFFLAKRATLIRARIYHTHTGTHGKYFSQYTAHRRTNCNIP